MCKQFQLLLPLLLWFPPLIYRVGENNERSVLTKQKDEASANKNVLDTLFTTNKAISSADSPL